MCEQNPFSFLGESFSLTQEKRCFFDILVNEFPLQDAIIQSSDGEFIDILWNNGVLLSLTDKNNLSISTLDDFRYFDNTQWKEALEFLLNMVT